MSISKSGKIKKIIEIGILIFVLYLIFFADIFSLKDVLAKISGTSQATTRDTWYNSAWSYRRKISVNPQSVASTTGANITSFPMLVSSTNNEFKFTEHGGRVASSTGGDLLFTNADGALLDFEIESYASTTGVLVAWVRIPFLSSTTTTSIYMYYGNASADNNQNPTGVWDSGYEVVYHLRETVADEGTAGSAYQDSTSNNNDGNQSGPDDATGKIGLGQDFDGTNDVINGPDVNDVDGIAAYTVEAWIKLDTTGDYETFVGKGSASTNRNDFGLGGSGVGGNDDLAFFLANGSNTYGYTSGNYISTATWHHVAVSYNGGGATNADKVKIYINGSEKSMTFSGTMPATTPTNANALQTGNAIGFIDGILDEVRVSTTNRSADWIKTEFRNQSLPESFYSMGGTESQTARINDSGGLMPAFKIRGGVKFR